VYNNFKSCNKVNVVLEHTPKHLAENYLSLIIKEFGTIINKIDWLECQKNDSIGNPRLDEFLGLKKYIKLNNYYFSGSTIQYIYSALKMSDIIRKFCRIESLSKMLVLESNPKLETSFNIIEIGGGYGGQCYIFNIIAKMFNIKIKSYNIIDLKGPCLLTEKYLNSLNIPNVKFYNALNYENYKNIFEKIEIDFILSSWCISELSINYSEKYFNDIVSKAKMGFIAWNNDYKDNSYRLSINNFTPEKFNNLKIVPSPLYTINVKNIIKKWEKAHAKFVKYVSFYK